MQRYRPSLLILKKRPRRIKGNRAIREWFMSLRREHELKALRRDLTNLERSCMSDIYRSNTQDVYITDLQQRSREIAAEVKLNTAEIAGIKARERPGWGVTEKGMHWDLTNANNQEIEILQAWRAAIDARLAATAAQAKRISDRLVNLERALGEDSDV